ncbi:MAG TPA: Do family serine endopeptidase [Gemmatimonadales bacterium]|nr:Do family serine endopeptidase [Gemmatimonadales bacterium]
MSVRTRDWLKFGTLLAMAFVVGILVFGLPKSSAAEHEVLAQAPPSAVIPAARPVADLGDAFAAIAERVKPAVVFISSEHQERPDTRRLPPGFEDFFPQFRNQHPQVEQATGSGFVVSPDGYILTNNHVIAGQDRVTVRLYDKREFTAKVVGADPATDVAVIKIDATNLPTVAFGNSDSTRIGEWVLAIGNPLGEEFAFTVTAGIVSAKGRLLPGLQQVPGYSIQDFIQTDAAINPGNSGGPLVDVHGNVIGINSAIASETGFYAGYGFAIPVNLARTVMNQLVSTGHVTRAVMGVEIGEVRQEDAELVGLHTIHGVVVENFSGGDESPAKKAGLEVGDVIVGLDNRPVDYVAQMQQLVGFKKPGDEVSVTVMRKGGVQKTFQVRLIAAPAADSEQLASNPSGAEEPKSDAVSKALGVSVEPVTADDAQDTNIRRVLAHAGGGLEVTDVSPDGPAYNRLSPPGAGGPDIILSVDDAAVHTRAELRSALASHKPGDIVTLLVYNVYRQQQQVVRIRLR